MSVSSVSTLSAGHSDDASAGSCLGVDILILPLDLDMAWATSGTGQEGNSLAAAWEKDSPVSVWGWEEEPVGWWEQVHGRGGVRC